MRIRGTDREGRDFDLTAVAGRWERRDGEQAIDLSGFHVLPGLVDAHAHLSAETLDIEAATEPSEILQRADDAVSSGVFAVADKGWSDDLVLALAREGRIGGLQVQAAGRMLRPHDGYWDGFGPIVDGSQLIEVCAAISPERPWVKIVGDWPRRGQGALPNYTEAVLSEAVDAAHAGGARVAIHTMAPEVASMAVRAGVDSIEHGLFLTEIDLEELGERSGMWVPTVLRMEEVLAGLKPGSSGAELVGRGLENVRRVLPAAAELGVAVLAGSDLAVPVGRIGLEVEALVRMGCPTEHAVAGASHRAYAALGIDAGLRVGAPADVVAFVEDPLEDRATLLSPVLVMREGRVITDHR